MLTLYSDSGRRWQETRGNWVEPTSRFPRADCEWRWWKRPYCPQCQCSQSSYKTHTPLFWMFFFNFLENIENEIKTWRKHWFERSMPCASFCCCSLVRLLRLDRHHIHHCGRGHAWTTAVAYLRVPRSCWQRRARRRRPAWRRWASTCHSGPCRACSWTSIEAAKTTGSTSTAKSRRLDSSEKMTIVNLALKIINECFILDTKEIQVCCCCQIYIYFLNSFFRNSK